MSSRLTTIAARHLGAGQDGRDCTAPLALNGRTGRTGALGVERSRRLARPGGAHWRTGDPVTSRIPPKAAADVAGPASFDRTLRDPLAGGKCDGSQRGAGACDANSSDVRGRERATPVSPGIP